MYTHLRPSLQKVAIGCEMLPASKHDVFAVLLMQKSEKNGGSLAESHKLRLSVIVIAMVLVSLVFVAYHAPMIADMSL